MSRRSALIAAGLSALAIGAYLAVLDGRMTETGGPGIVGFEFAWTEQRSTEIVTQWGEQGSDAARLSLRVDFAYLLAYGAFLALAAASLRDLARRRGWRRMRAAGAVAVRAAVVAPGCDAVENLWLLIALEGSAGGVAPLMGSLFASLKFALLAFAVAYLLVGLALLALRRPPAGPA